MAGNAIISLNQNRMRSLLLVAAALFCAMFFADPAWAFAEAGNTIVSKTNEAIQVAKRILITAAVLALIVGLAPMLWGQVKVKWIISSLVACVLFGLTGTIVSAFAS